MRRHYKAYTILIFLLLLGLSSRFSIAGSVPLAAPVVPAQSSQLAPLTEIGQSVSQSIEVLKVEGAVFFAKQGSNDFQSIQSGAELHTGDIIKTSEGSCHLRMEGKNDLYLGAYTELKVTEAFRNERDKTYTTLLTMESGKLKAALSKLKKGSTFKVQSPTAIASVRGTVFYLNVGNFFGQNSAQIFVEQSHGGVLFTNITTGKSFLIPAFSLSNSFADGKLDEPKELNSDQQDAFVENWESAGSDASGQFNIEEIPNPDSGDTEDEIIEDDVLDENTDAANSDALQDRVSEQNIPGSNGFASDPTDSSSSQEAEVIFSLALRERNMLRKEIARIRNDQDFDHADANLAKVSDTQTNKTFVDVFGNRVRVDQYIFYKPETATVEFLSLTARTGEYQKGVSSVLFGTQFNRFLGNDVNLKSLPWGDYMNVVTRQDVATNLDISQGSSGYNDLYEEYIVHEHAPNLTHDESALYPTHFYAEFTNPAGENGERGGRDYIRFDDFYSKPFDLELQVDGESQSIAVQAKLGDVMQIRPFGGQYILRLNNYQHVEGGNNGNNNGDDHGGDGTQTSSFAGNFDVSKLLDINYYKNLPENSDGNPDNDEHPAYFDDHLSNRLDGDYEIIGRNHLIGLFIPINDSGQIIDQPGFGIRGLRDLFNPNPLVNGGDYNLEIILLYGYDDRSRETQDGFSEGTFHEDFRIDVIITPEIFQPYMGASDRRSILFPLALRPDDDDEFIFQEVKGFPPLYQDSE